MFVRSRRAPAPGGQDLRFLRLSLNAPVLARADFPVGPAAAALVEIVEPEGPRQLLVLRAIRGGHVASFECGEAGSGPEAGLAAAEAMGLLFDDELVAEGLATARAAWADFLGEPEGAALEASASGPRLSKFRFQPGAQSPPGKRAEAARVRQLARY